MKLIKTLFFFSFLLLTAKTIAQIPPKHQCGVLTDMQDMDRLVENKLLVKNLNIQRKGAMYYIPVKLHLVAKTNGTGRISEAKAMEGICGLNEYFKPLDMQFYLTGEFNYINNDGMYDLEFPNVPQSVTFQYRVHKVDNAANVFIGNGLSSGNSGYYSRNQDIIYMDKRYVNAQDNILAHEFGHFFSLAHTFFGWEAIPDDPDGIVAPIRAGNVDVEYVDRTKNCETAADRFCDTPADYIQNWSGACDYTGGAMDPDSVKIDPDEMNLMAYYSFRGCSEYYFSEAQMDVITADYLSRKDLSDLLPPNQNPITETTNLTFPINEEAVNPANEIIFEWDEVSGATRYLIEISPLESLAFLETKAFVTDNFFKTTLNADRKEGYWRVLAFNDVHFCNIQYSDVERFTISDMTSTIDFSLVENLSIYPSPSSDDDVMVQFFNLDLPATIADFEIFDLTGKSIFQVKNQRILKGENNISLSVSGLDSGIYFFKIISEGILVGKEKIVRF